MLVWSEHTLFLLNHINVPIIHRHFRRRIRRWSSILHHSVASSPSFLAPPVILHLLIELLLRLARPAIHDRPPVPAPGPHGTPLPARAARPAPPPPRAAPGRHVPVHAVRRRLAGVGPPRRAGAAAPAPPAGAAPPVRFFDALEQAPPGLHGGVEWVARGGAGRAAADADVGARGGWAGWHEGEADGLAVGVGPVEGAHGFASVG